MSLRRIQADDFFNAYLVLHENNEALIRNLETSPGNSIIEKKVFSTLPTMGIDVVCLAFSVELYIKEVHYALKGKAPRGHHILKLFEKLPEKIQHDIFNHQSIRRYGWSFEEFKQEIEQISDGFEKWRYSYESSTLRYNTYIAEVLIEAMKYVSDVTHRQSAAQGN